MWFGKPARALKSDILDKEVCPVLKFKELEVKLSHTRIHKIITRNIAFLNVGLDKVNTLQPVWNAMLVKESGDYYLLY